MTVPYFGNEHSLLAVSLFFTEFVSKQRNEENDFNRTTSHNNIGLFEAKHTCVIHGLAIK